MIKYELKRSKRQTVPGFLMVGEDSKTVDKSELKRHLEDGWTLVRKKYFIITDFKDWWKALSDGNRIAFIGVIILPILYFLFQLLPTPTDKNQNKIEPKIPVEKAIAKKDTIFNYLELEYDTIKSSKAFDFENVEYLLDLKTYSLNDSLIKRNSSDTINPYFDISHTRITRLTLTNKHIRTSINIKRQDFKKLLDSIFYAKCYLLSTELKSIAQDTIYFTTELAIPDTDIQWRIRYYYLIKNHRLAKQYLDSKEYVGK